MSSTPMPAQAPRRWLAFVLGFGCVGLILYGAINIHIMYFSLGCLLLIWLLAHVCLRSTKFDYLGLFLLLSILFCLQLAQYMTDTRGIHLRKSNMIELVAAIKNYDIDNNHLPHYAILDQQGKPLLSWRVLLLPQLGYQKLFQSFRMNEPWNSEHNIALIPQIPEVYRPVEVLELDHETGRQLIKTRTRPGLTHIVAMRGPGSVFDSKLPIRASAIKSNALFFAEAGELICWTKPEDITIDPSSPPPWLKAYQSGRGFTVLGYLDGTVVNYYEGEDDSAFLNDSKLLLERIDYLPKQK